MATSNEELCSLETWTLGTTPDDDDAMVPTTFVTDRLAWVVILPTVSDACGTKLSVLDDTSTPRDWVRVPLGVRLTCTVADEGLCATEPV